MAEKSSGITRALERAPAPLFVAYAGVVSFAVYFCMYAFRKPFAAASYEGTFFGAIELKTAFVIAQVVGYTASKYLGIKVVSEVKREGRVRALLGLVLLAEAALGLFAVLPERWRVIAMFANGLPLGMVWGLVVRYLEGRRSSELLLATLSCSFIVASGVVKDIGRFVMTSWGASEALMPFATGLLFVPPFVVFALLLDRLPAPSAADVAARTERVPMDAAKRSDFLRTFLPGIVSLLVAYFLLTAYRDYRDNYGAELVRELGYGDDPAIFTATETPVALGVLASLALLHFVRDNRRGLLGAYAIMSFGALLVALATLGFDLQLLDGQRFLMLVGLGSYLAYVPYGSVLFDRLIAATRSTGTAVFTIYLADAIGYTGSVLVQLVKDLLRAGDSRLSFFRLLSYVVAGTSLLLFAASYAYFARNHLKRT